LGKLAFPDVDKGAVDKDNREIPFRLDVPAQDRGASIAVVRDAAKS